MLLNDSVLNCLFCSVSVTRDKSSDNPTTDCLALANWKIEINIFTAKKYCKDTLVEFYRLNRYFMLHIKNSPHHALHAELFVCLELRCFAGSPQDDCDDSQPRRGLLYTNIPHFLLLHYRKPNELEMSQNHSMRAQKLLAWISTGKYCCCGNDAWTCDGGLHRNKRGSN